MHPPVYQARLRRVRGAKRKSCSFEFYDVLFGRSLRSNRRKYFRILESKRPGKSGLQNPSKNWNDKVLRCKDVD